MFINPRRYTIHVEGQTPADKAGIIIKGNDKWKTLIERASLG